MSDKTAIERATDLTAPPVVGRRYLVPVVTFPWTSDKPGKWPVLLPRHDDADFFNFPWPHYHVDARFLSDRAFARLELRDIFARPLGGRKFRDGPSMERPIIPVPPVHGWAPRWCRREMPAYPFLAENPVRAVQAAYAGRQCKAAAGGWVCPHRGVALGSFAPGPDGRLICPGHGLRVDAASGIVCPAEGNLP